MSTLVKSNSFPSWRAMMDDFWNTDRFFNQAIFRDNILPAVNIKDAENQYELEVAAPGFKKEDFKVSTDHGLLMISAETTAEQEEDQGDYTRREFSRSSFRRTFSLPDNVVEDDISASYQDGLLKLALKKSDKSISAKKQVLIS
jgi:HSP20 family protein